MPQPQGKKRRRARYHFSFVVLAAIAAFIICFVLYMKNTTLEQVLDGSSLPIADSVTDSAEDSALDSTSDESITDESSVSDNVPAGSATNPIGESASVGMDYFNTCAFVGDSITDGLASYQIFDRKNVYASIGMNIQKIDTEVIATSYGEMTVLEGLVQRNPQNIYIMLGSNGIAWLTNDQMISKYSAFIDSIKIKLPNSKIYVISIPPVTASREVAAESPIKNSDIDAYNSELLKLANEKSVYFVDLNTALKDNSGKFPDEMAARDGYHFQRSTYDVMLDFLMTHVAN